MPGMSLTLQHNFSRDGSHCLGGSGLCLDNIALTQTTGSEHAFRHNTTTVELTASIGGFPLLLWGRSGYNTNLVDYFQYVNSIGLGLQLMNW